MLLLAWDRLFQLNNVLWKRAGFEKSVKKPRWFFPITIAVTLLTSTITWWEGLAAATTTSKCFTPVLAFTTGSKSASTWHQHRLLHGTSPSTRHRSSYVPLPTSPARRSRLAAPDTGRCASSRAGGISWPCCLPAVPPGDHVTGPAASAPPDRGSRTAHRLQSYRREGTPRMYVGQSSAAERTAPSKRPGKPRQYAYMQLV